MSSLEGVVALVTGAARGQGRSHAVSLAAAGADIIAVDSCRPIATVPYPLPEPADLDETVDLVRKEGQRAIAGVVDIRDLALMEQFMTESVAALGGRLDVVCANAGISTPNPTLTMSEEVWQATLDVNLTGAWKTCRAAVPHIIAGGRGGTVLLTSSAATTITSANIAHYTASKFGLVGLMRVLAKELAPHRIRVNTLHPTGVETPMIINEPMYRLFRPDLDAPTREDFEESARTHNALGVPWVQPEDVSNAVVYLASHSGRFITGTEFRIDAGGPLA
jgi:SDR family mycofactocin-dependent oxidoreductase